LLGTPLEDVDGIAYQLFFSPDGKRLVANHYFQIYIVDAEALKLRTKMAGCSRRAMKMAFVKCSVHGCGRKLQPILKVDPRDRDTWFYPECDHCFRPVCAEHSAAVKGQVVCDHCRKEMEAPPLIDLGLRLKAGEGK
jgi:hypothetical protein